jgi:hypothetical protein
MVELQQDKDNNNLGKTIPIVQRIILTQWGQLPQGAKSLHIGELVLPCRGSTDKVRLSSPWIEFD